MVLLTRATMSLLEGRCLMAPRSTPVECIAGRHGGGNTDVRVPMSLLEGRCLMLRVCAHVSVGGQVLNGTWVLVCGVQRKG